MREDELDRVCRQGKEAWERLATDQSWTDWIAVGEALLIGRTQAMAEAETNVPAGKGYNQAFSRWLKKYELHKMDSGDRTRLFEVMDNRLEIEKWRGTLGQTLRLKLNHPSTVLRRWKARTQPKKEKDPNKPTLTNVNIKLQEELDASKRENAGLKAHAADLEAARGSAAIAAADGLPVEQLDGLFYTVWNSLVDAGEGKALEPKQAKQRKAALHGFRTAWQNLRKIVEQQASPATKEPKPFFKQKGQTEAEKQIRRQAGLTGSAIWREMNKRSKDKSKKTKAESGGVALNAK